MNHAHQILPAGTWPAATACDHIALDYDARHRRRFRYTADAGTEFLLDLPRAAVIHDGDGLLLDDGRVVRVDAAPEALIEVTAANPHELLRLAWHIGNRHLPAQLSAERILIRDDHVIVAMLHGLGATTRAVSAPFTPESGAYAGGHSHGDTASFVFVGDHGHGQGH
ncbi:urease accessory protein UreE [Solimonas marina]|uniref:Urease accessory protein UreE n=1 Tax=Solimonas marina TaxID=2714601 RepID=A0A969WBC7_9GAMM|nr:urease accessory protein UreE [Solimonas marina]NKF23044.1 urease accessory protein UreE [Solimonas marina]